MGKTPAVAYTPVHTPPLYPYKQTQLMSEVIPTLVEREDVLVNAASGGATKFSVMQFNILADSLSDSFPEADPKILEWSYREELIVAQITSRQPTVVCLEECDHFEDLETRLSPSGYKGFFIKKTSEFNKDGCAIFYRSDVVECLDHRTAGLGGTQVTIVAHFVLKKTAKSTLEECKTADASRRIFVAVTHLKAKVGYEEKRLAQTQTLLDVISKYISEDGPSMNFNIEDVSR